jgi:hypothetical protein
MSTAFSVILKSTPVPFLDGKQASFQLTGPTSYTTGGIVCNAALFQSFGVNLFKHLVIKSVNLGLIAQWDEVNNKIKLFYPTGGASAPASLGAPSATATPATGVTAVTSTSAEPAIPVTAVGGEGIELASATNVSTVVLQILLQYR